MSERSERINQHGKGPDGGACGAVSGHRYPADSTQLDVADDRSENR